MRSLILVLCLCMLGHCQDETSEESQEKANLAEGETKMSESILANLEHFKHPDPVGLPGLEIPEPYLVPDTNQEVSYGTLYFKNTAVYGINNFDIQFKTLYINAEVGSMEVQAAMSINHLQARGNYTIFSWLIFGAQGPFTVDVTGLIANARANLGTERDGKLRVQGINIDLSFSTIAVNFENLGVYGSVFQSKINSIGSKFFDSIKPYILKEAYGKMRVEINSKLEDFREIWSSLTPYHHGHGGF